MKFILYIIFVFASIFAVGQNHMVGYEYWFDDDFAGKVTTPVAPVTQLSLNTNVSTASLNAGVHTISIRSWDENKKYSSVLTQFFYKIPEQTASATNELVGYEYWIDDDYGNATYQTVTNQSMFNLLTLVSTASINSGIHSFSIRFKDNSGMWSSVLTQFFYKIPEQAVSVTKELVAYEYWVDDNYGGAVYQTITNQSVYNLSSIISMATNNTGIHSFCIRFKDNSDMWSSVLTQFYYKVPQQAVSVTNELVEYEYWFDNDYANAIVMPIANQQVYNLNTLISTNSMNTGIHSLNIRFKDNTNLWSSILTQFIYKKPENSSIGTKEIVAYEYWFDNAYSSAVLTPVSNQSIYNINSLISTSAIQVGVHTLSIRFQDNTDLWSSTLTHFFYKMPEEPVLANNLITHYRYWFDSDFGNVVEVNLSTPSHQLNLIDDLDLTQLPHGMHSIHFQFKDSVQLWSSITIDSIEKIGFPIADFSIATVENCDSTIITMVDNSIDADKYLWDFGSGNTSSLQEPSFIFYEAGVYPITLTVTDTVLMLDSTLTTYVTVHTNTESVLTVDACSSFTSPSGLYTWTENGTYYDTIPNTFGCDSIITVQLTLKNTSSSLIETACYAYTAPDGAVYSSSGMYTAVIPNAAGCDSTISIDLTINTVDVGVTENGYDFTANQSFATYQWLDCETNYSIIPGETGQTFSATSNGSYAVELTQNGCTDTSSCYTVSTIGFYENGALTKLKVYPNPTSGKVYVNFGKTMHQISYRLLDAQGRTISSEKLEEMEEISFDIHWPAGVYFLKIICDDASEEFSIVKN